MLFLIHFAVAHAEFRLPEVESIAECYGFKISFSEEQDTSRPFMIVDLESEDYARILAQRCVLIKAVYELWAHASSYDELHVLAQSSGVKNLWGSESNANATFKFLVTSFNHTIPLQRQKDVIESFSYMNFRGEVKMSNPDLIVACLEEYYYRGKNTFRAKEEGDGKFRQVYLGRRVAEGTARALINKFNVKKRVYYGNTSMDAEMSLLMANQTLASPGKLIYDPLAGTGSMLYTAAHFGALVLGSDIDGRQMRGKGRDLPGVVESARQYEVDSLLVDCCTFDITRHPWRCGDIFDAIVTDPPYGVRAGSKRLGRRDGGGKTWYPAKVLESKIPRHLQQGYVPPTRPYELSDLASDLVILARYLLKPGGRLVFFLPTVTDEYQEVDVPSCIGMEVIANSVQDFGKWGRRLITMRKTLREPLPAPSFNIFKDGQEGDHVPAHKDFRTKYFAGFKKAPEET